MKTKEMAEMTLIPIGLTPRVALSFCTTGSLQKIRGSLRGGGYDHMLWTAECSAVAQSYIPASGLNTYVQFPSWHRDDEPTQPLEIVVDVGRNLDVFATGETWRRARALLSRSSPAMYDSVLKQTGLHDAAVEQGVCNARFCLEKKGAQALISVGVDY